MAVVNADIPDQLKRRLEAEAERDMRSQRGVLVLALEAYLTAREQASAGCANIQATHEECGSIET